MALRHIFIGQHLEDLVKQLTDKVERLTEKLEYEREKRLTDKLAWDDTLRQERADGQARQNALNDKLLFMAGVPSEQTMNKAAQETVEYRPPDAYVPGSRSVMADEAREKAEDEFWRNEWQKLEVAARQELQREEAIEQSLAPEQGDESLYTG